MPEQWFHDGCISIDITVGRKGTSEPDKKMLRAIRKPVEYIRGGFTILTIIYDGNFGKMFLQYVPL